MTCLPSGVRDLLLSKLISCEQQQIPREKLLGMTNQTGRALTLPDESRSRYAQGVS
jgi:hypothetical protein